MHMPRANSEVGTAPSRQCANFRKHTSCERRHSWTSESKGGQYRNLDLGRPGIVIVHRRSAKGLSFDTVVIPDTHWDAGTDPTSATLRMSYYVMATRARQELHLGHEGQSEPPLLAQINRMDLQRG